MCLPRSDQGEDSYCCAFALAGSKEVGNGGFGIVQPSGRCLSGKGCSRIVVGVVAFVLKVAEEVGEDLGVDRESGSVLLKLGFGVAVVEATVYPNPCVGCQLVIGGTDKHVGVTGGEGVERCVVGSADGPSYGCRSWLGGWRLGSEGCPAGGYEIRPIDWRGHTGISLLLA